MHATPTSPVPLNPMHLLRHPAPALRRALLCLLVLAWGWQSQTSLLQQWLGVQHHHRAAPQAPAPGGGSAGATAAVLVGWWQQAGAWASALQARRASALMAHGRSSAPLARAAETAPHGPVLHDHLHTPHHDGWERHHHAKGDGSVALAGDVALDDDAASGHGSGAGGHGSGTAGGTALPWAAFSGLRPSSPAMATGAWSRAGAPRWASAEARLPERPPRA